MRTGPWDFTPHLGHTLLFFAGKHTNPAQQEKWESAHTIKQTKIQNLAALRLWFGASTEVLQEANQLRFIYSALFVGGGV